MTLKFTILGCGHSAGTPTIGNFWGACDPNEPRNRRTRASAVIQSENTTLLIDTGPDLREQANRAGLTKIDAVIYTHSHADHIMGIEDLRVMRMRHKKLIPVHGNPATINELERRFQYLFVELAEIYPKVLDPYIIHDTKLNRPMTIGDIEFTPFAQDHITCESLGFRFGDLAYSTDMKDIGQQALESLVGIKTWIVDAAGYNIGSPVHADLNEIYQLNDIVKAERVVLTHMPAYMDYQTLCSELPSGYEPAYDGMTFDIV